MFVVWIGGMYKVVEWVVLVLLCMLMCMESELCCGWPQLKVVKAYPNIDFSSIFALRYRALIAQSWP